MIASRRWLEALLGRPLDARDVAERLSMQCATVDAVVPLHQDLRDVVVARVLEVKPHPNADRLTLCLVDTGGGAPLVQRSRRLGSLLGKDRRLGVICAPDGTRTPKYSPGGVLALER